MDFLDILRQRAPGIMAEYDATGEEKERITAELDEKARAGSLASVQEARAGESQERQERWKALADRLGDDYRECRLANYHTYSDPATARRQTAIVKRLLSYCEGMPAEVKSGRGVVLFGPSGTGKDHLITALARAAILTYGLSVRWVRGSAFCIESRDAMGSDVSEGNMVNKYSFARILYISDPLPPIGGLTPYQATMLYEILDERNRQKRPTWVTLNVANRADADRRLGAANVERLIERALKAECDWPSYRSRKEAK